jgi:hypothetical protein
LSKNNRRDTEQAKRDIHANMASKGYLNEADRLHIADRIVAGASSEETNVDGLVALASIDHAAV